MLFKNFQKLGKKKFGFAWFRPSRLWSSNHISDKSVCIREREINDVLLQFFRPAKLLSLNYLEIRTAGQIINADSKHWHHGTSYRGSVTSHTSYWTVFERIAYLPYYANWNFSVLWVWSILLVLLWIQPSCVALGLQAYHQWRSQGRCKGAFTPPSQKLLCTRYKKCSFFLDKSMVKLNNTF